MQATKIAFLRTVQPRLANRNTKPHTGSKPQLLRVWDTQTAASVSGKAKIFNAASNLAQRVSVQGRVTIDITPNSSVRSAKATAL